MLWLKASASNEFATIGSVRLIGMILLRKNRLNIMIPLIAGTLNPDAFCLICRWDGHDFSPLHSLIETIRMAQSAGNIRCKDRSW